MTEEKKINGRKRHIAVDSQGNLIKVHVSAANISDKQGLCKLFSSYPYPFYSIHKMWADQGYQGQSLKEIASKQKIDLKIVKRPPSRYRIYNEKWQAEWVALQREFDVLPRRWVVERTFAWMNKNRRLSKDYEYLTDVSEAYLYVGMSRILLRRMVKN